MRMIMKAALLAGALAAPASTAFAWNLAPCSVAVLQRRAEAARELRAAQPGSLKYVPKHFPRNGAELVENYRYHILSSWKHIDGAAMSSEQRALLDGLRNNTVAIKVERVQNWGIRRCGDPGSGDSYHLLRISDRASGREIARAALHESGVVEQTGFAGPSDKPLASLAEVATDVERTVGASAQSPVYVTSTGTLRCDALMPCVAVRARDSVFLTTPDGELFEIPARRRVLSFKNDLGTNENRARTQQDLAARGEVVTSLGGDQFVVVERRGRIAKN